jgi:hypothetical protein
MAYPIPSAPPASAGRLPYLPLQCRSFFDVPAANASIAPSNESFVSSNACASRLVDTSSGSCWESLVSSLLFPLNVNVHVVLFFLPCAEKSSDLPHHLAAKRLRFSEANSSLLEVIVSRIREEFLCLCRVKKSVCPYV